MDKRLARLGGTLIALCAFLSGCYHLQSADAPMDVLYYPHHNGYQASEELPLVRSSDLLILLPGMGNRIDSFEQAGVLEQLAQAQIPVDAVMVDAHFAYYRARNFLPRLQQDVLLPAREAGYQRVHLAGISLGGFGSLLYWQYNLDQPTEGLPVASAMLLTPYLGEPEYYAHRLNPQLSPQLVSEDKNIWLWLEQLPPEQRQHWYLGLAEQDEFYQANRTFADLLPEDQVFTTPGGHTWDSWRDLWPRVLAQFKRDFFQSPTEESP
ncbi:hypothetical protein [Gilvimarinus sp. 1_MG-2023]|uniref:hypothetical protein n=1 Tax=Gilvimarinus sp. 1_MG-2023 TaxID=3062638 RepID=UPI0026E3BC1B|nr:hypothetical protein [Gilvimarinus sp. 1_MG-2023]MDO6748549.1 hypothetical protein [Gilvimarinus sp. 1_MG-2023]